MRNRFGLGIVLATLLAGFGYAQPFTYQGMLKQNGNPANGTLSMTFKLYDALTEGNQVGSPITQNVSVQNGLFTVSLDFGNVWNGSDRYLEIAVGSTVLSPRVKINATPYAGFAQTAGFAQRPWQSEYNRVYFYGHVGIYTDARGPAVLSLGPHDMPTKLAIWQGSQPHEMMGLGVVPGVFTFTLPNANNRFAFYNNPWPIPDEGAVSLMTILGNGNVGIGTDSPAGRLSLGDGEGFTKLILWQGNAGSMGFGVGAGQMRFYVPNSNHYFSFLNAPTGNEIVTIRGNGNVGIGTTNPAARLSLGGDNANTKLALWQGPNSGDLMGFGIGPGQFRLHLHHSGNRFSFLNAPNGSELMTIRGNGDVGIGTGINGPSYRLHVVEDNRNRLTAIYGVHTYSTDQYTTHSTYGVYGLSRTNFGAGVYGRNESTGNFATFSSGVYGYCVTGSGVLGETADESRGYGVFSFGRIGATRTKEFLIDHPLYPETHFLHHFCAEGPDPYNIYRGTVVLDARGEAWVQLPDYFEAINRDPSYHLTAVGAPMPNLHIAQKIRGNRFKIAGGAPRGEVSWEVKAIRNDRAVQQYGYQTETEKPKEIQGMYIYPELYGQPKEKGIFYRPEPVRPESTPAQPNEK